VGEEVVGEVAAQPGRSAPEPRRSSRSAAVMSSSTPWHSPKWSPRRGVPVLPSRRFHRTGSRRTRPQQRPVPHSQPQPLRLLTGRLCARTHPPKLDAPASIAEKPPRTEQLRTNRPTGHDPRLVMGAPRHRNWPWIVRYPSRPKILCAHAARDTRERVTGGRKGSWIAARGEGSSEGVVHVLGQQHEANVRHAMGR
jgi:hypothetical protein